MGIILLIMLSFMLSGKFKNAGVSGAGKYIGGMIAQILGMELFGFAAMNASGSPITLLLFMLVGFVGVFFIYRT